VYPWWQETDAAEPLTQGDLIQGCPVAVFKEHLGFGADDSIETLLNTLRTGVGIQTVRSIIMTQACDLEQKKVRNVILCPAQTLDEFRADWEEDWTTKKGVPPKVDDWKSRLKEILAARVFNLALLHKREAADGVQLTTPTLVVDFHEVFSLPLDFLQLWAAKSGERRLRLMPPYREHLSQGFARFFMRVGLPVDIKDP
jgi:hypothetical protein